MYEFFKARKVSLGWISQNTGIAYSTLNTYQWEPERIYTTNKNNIEKLANLIKYVGVRDKKDINNIEKFTKYKVVEEKERFK